MKINKNYMKKLTFKINNKEYYQGSIPLELIKLFNQDADYVWTEKVKDLNQNNSFLSQDFIDLYKDDLKDCELCLISNNDDWTEGIYPLKEKINNNYQK